jgi:transglutaminase-like putative cysteine protease
MKKYYLSKIIFLLLTTLLLSSCQPGNKQAEEANKENPVKPKKKATITDVERGIRANITTQAAANNGIFTFKNDTAEFNLKLVRVHTEYLSVLKPDEFFACVDLATENGDVYDMDFFLAGNADSMQVTRTTLHKLNGKPYYSWKQRKDKTWYTVPVAQSSNRLLGVIEDTDRFTFTYALELPEVTGQAQIWLPIAQSGAYQTVQILSMRAPDNHRIIKDTKYGNAILIAELGPGDSHQPISITYQVTRHEKSPYPDNEANLARYLEANSLLPVSSRFKTLADEIIAQSQAKNDLEKARALYDYVSDNLRYAKQGTYGTGDATYACDSKSGNCTEFHSLFISLARSAGIPARFAVGAAIPSSRNEGGVDGYHCWAEFYADDKWWPVDISEANKYSALATYYFGHHPANRIEFTRGRDIAPEPLPKSGPINFLAYPVFEVNGQPDLVTTTFSFTRTTDVEE